MDLDAKICYCFHVTRRKLVNFVRQRKPKVPSQLSECGGAGTGCGWCIPFLKQIFHEGVRGGATAELERLTPEEYERRRAEYIRAGKGTPPPGATPLPTDDVGPTT
jgi:bacterioferritin-associated ferredoxin